MKKLALIFSCLGIASAVGTQFAIADVLPFSKPQICKAGISLMMSKSPSIMKESSSGDEVKISYVRPEDSSTWTYKCKIEGSRIVWGSDPGRWRNSAADEPISYSVSGSGNTARLTVEVRYQDGSSNKKIFMRDELK